MGDMTSGEMLKLRPAALSFAINQIASPEGLWALKEVFFTKLYLPGTKEAKWSLERENRKIGKWNVQGNPAQPVAGAPLRILSATWGHIFMKMTLDEDFLLWIKSNSGDNSKDQALQHMMNAQRILVSKEAVLLEEAAIQALGGGISISYTTDPTAQIIMDCTFGFNATHNGSNTSCNWSTAGHKILSHATESWADIAQLIEDDCGLQADEVVMNRVTNKYLVGNTEVASYYSDKTKDSLMQDNRVKRLDGLNVKIYNRKYQDLSGTSTKFIKDAITYWLPAKEQRDSFKMLEGECLAPQVDEKGIVQGNDLVKVPGRACWIEFHTDPTEAVIYLKHNVLPVPTDPDAVVRRQVVPVA